MAARKRAHARRYGAAILLLGGCSVYESSLLGEPVAMGGSSGGGEAGEPSAVAGKPATAGSSGAGATAGTGGASGSGGTSADGGSDGHAGESPSGGEPSTGGEASTGGEGGTAACVPESASEFCARLGKECGSVDGTDSCGNAITGVDCGSCSGLKTCGGGDEANVCGVLTDPARGGTATASTVMFSHENGSRAFDLDLTTKWYAGDGNTTGWIAYQFPGTEAHVVRAYSVTSANDVPQRDPTAWQLQGSNNGSSWTTVDTRTGLVWTNRRETLTFACAGNTSAYRRYRLLVTANNGGTGLQLSELALYAQ